MNSRIIALGVLLASVLGLARAETTLCTAITTLPTNIRSAGNYCLQGDLTTSITSGAAIQVLADNVTIDLNGFRLDGSGGGAATTARGIFLVARQNVTIRNGTVRAFARGILLWDSSPYNNGGHLIEDVRAIDNTETGILVGGSNNVVRRCLVTGTGGTGSAPAPANARGIAMYGPNATVVNNDVGDTTMSLPWSGSAIAGVRLIASPGAVVARNRVRTFADVDVGSLSFLSGIQLNSSPGSAVTGNEVVTDSTPGPQFLFTSGILLESSSDSVVQDNRVLSDGGATRQDPGGVVVSRSLNVIVDGNVVIGAEVGIDFADVSAAGVPLSPLSTGVYRGNTVLDHGGTSVHRGTDGGRNVVQ